MATDKKTRKDKEIVVELESQIKDIRQLLAEQLRCIDQHLDCRVGMLQDLQEYYRRHAEVELEFSKSLDKLAKQLSVRQKKDPAMGYSTHSMWQMLMETTRQQSRNRGFISDILHPVVVSKLSDITDDTQRIYKRCREMVTNHQDELFKVLTELDNSMKTYHTYHGNSQQAESKLLRVQSQRVKVDQQNAISKRFINYDKKAEQKQAKFTENKLKAMKARNEYLLTIDSTNAALKKYFTEDFPKLVEKMDFGYHALLSQAFDIHITACRCLVNSDQERLDAFIDQRKNIIALNDNEFFRGQNYRLFVKPEGFAYQPHKGDEICRFIVPATAQEEMLLSMRMVSIKERIDVNTRENEARYKELQSVERELCQKVGTPDLDIVQIFRDEKTCLKSPTDKEKRREERLKTEDAYFQNLHKYMKTDSLITRLNTKFAALRKAVGDGNYENMHLEASSEPVRKRLPPSLPPKPQKCVKNPNGRQPKLFGGTIEEYVEATGTQIPIVIRSCIRIINLFGMHHQGIFRVPGSQNEINNYRQQFEKGIDPLTEKMEGDEINSVAGLLKLYFRELGEPLFPADKFSELISIPEKFSGNEEESKSSLLAIMSSLPRPRMIVLRYLFAFLNHLSEFSDENMMDAYNLAVCFGPTLLPTPVTTDISNHVYVNRLVEIMILHQEDLFPSGGDVVYEKCIVDDEKDFLDGISDDDVLNSNVGDEDDEYEDHEAIAEYDYQGRSGHELSFKRGDVLLMLNRVSAHWWYGEFMGVKGLIPDKYVQIPKKSRGKLTNLKKGHAQAKSSDCLLSPDDASFSSSSSLDRSVSQPNVAVPVPSLPQLGVPVSDQLPSVPHTRQIPGGQDPAEDNGNTLPGPGGVSSGSDAIVERISDDKMSDSGSSAELLGADADLDVVIPASGHSPSPFSTGEASHFDAKMLLLPGGVRKSTSFRDASETPQRPASGIVLKGSSSAGRADCMAPKSGGRMSSRSSTLPPCSVMPGMSGFDSDLLEEINSFSTSSRSSPGEARKKAVPPVRPRPPTKKAVDNNRTTTSASSTAIPPGVAKPNITISSSPETASKK